jgi:hypothetical protein
MPSVQGDSRQGSMPPPPPSPSPAPDFPDGVGFKVRTKPCYQGSAASVATDLEVAKVSVSRLQDFLEWSDNKGRPISGADGGEVIDTLSILLASDNMRALINRALLADDSAGTRHASFNHAVSQLAEIPGVAELFRPPSTARGPSPIVVEDPNVPAVPKGKGKAKAMPAR